MEPGCAQYVLRGEDVGFVLFVYSGCKGLGPYQREPSKEGSFAEVGGC